jgi:hypothetical protein
VQLDTAILIRKKNRMVKIRIRQVYQLSPRDLAKQPKIKETSASSADFSVPFSTYAPKSKTWKEVLSKAKRQVYLL